MYMQNTPSIQVTGEGGERKENYRGEIFKREEAIVRGNPLLTWCLDPERY